MLPKRHEHLTHHHLGNTKTSICLQQDIKKVPSLPPQEASNYHPPITKHPAKQKLRNFIEMQIWEQTSTSTFWPTHITHPSHLYHLHYNPHPQLTPQHTQCTTSTTFLHQTTHPTHHKYHLTSIKSLYPSPCTSTTCWHYVSHVLMSVRNMSTHSILTYPSHTHTIIYYNNVYMI